jgi:hypothetical protein
LTFEADSKLARIGDSAFRHCSSLKLVCFPGSLEVICKACFEHCTALSSLSFDSDSHLTRIGEHAFRYCSSLRTICFPSSVEVIGERNF